MTRHKAFGLYLLVVAFVFVSFLLGLMIGTGSIARREAHPTRPPYEPVENLEETQLDFYDELSKPIQEEKRSEPEIVVESKPAPRAQPETQKSTEVSSGGPEKRGEYTIQVAAHSTLKEAEQLLIRLRAKSFEGRIREPDRSSGDKYFRVWVGDFASSSEAETYANQLKEEGFHTYIRRTQ